MALGERLKNFFGIQSSETQGAVAPAPKKSVDQINQEFANKMTPETQAKFNDRRAQNAIKEVSEVSSNPAEDLQNVRNQIAFFGQLELSRLNADELTKVTQQVEKQIDALKLLPMSDETKKLEALLEEKKTEIISTVSKRIERQANG